MNIVKREFKHNLKALIIWISVMFVLSLIYSYEFTAFAKSPEILEYMSEFADMFRYLGVSFEDILTPAGFISLVALYYYIPFSIYSGLLGSSIISKEERAKTAEYLFTLPVTRQKVLVSKIFVVIINSLVLNVVTIGLMTILMSKNVEDNSFYKFIGLLSIGVFLTQMIFMSLGMLFSSVMKQYKRSGAYTVGVLLFTYLLHILVGLSDKIEFLKYVVPFKYFEPTVILSDMKIELIFVLITLAIVVSCLSGVFVFYKKRDLYI